VKTETYYRALEQKDGSTKRDIIYAANGEVMEIEEALRNQRASALSRLAALGGDSSPR
jgi:hypothetical protein